VGASPTLIFLLRHGSVLGAETRRFIGHLDVPLSDLGVAQLRAQARELEQVPLAAVFTSDLTRSRVSGEIIAEPHGLIPKAVPALREMAMGRWEGLTNDEICAREPEAFERWMASIGEFPFPEGESVPDLAARAWPAFEEIADAHAGGSIALVAHGGTNRALLCRAFGLPLGHILSFGQDYGALTVIERARGEWRLRRLNERPVV
jgi:broad specificity phosphatase PhoE